jgi:hypothetical protein
MEPHDRALLDMTLRQLADSLDGSALSEALDRFGFADVLVQAPREAVACLFGAMGRAGSMSSALQAVLTLPLAGVLGPEAAASNVVLPLIGESLAGRVERGIPIVRGLVLGQRPPALLFAPVEADGGVVWVRLAGPASYSSRRVAGLDPSLGMLEITAVGRNTDILSDGAEAEHWQAVATAGRRALAYQILGAVGRMIDLAVEHARVRVQFGQPVGSFQAVRHRLALAHVAREGAVAALEVAWETEDEHLGGILAKSLAGRAARIAATQCQQVLAGVGFTAEHPFHHFLARATVLGGVLGSASDLPRIIGARLASAGTIARLVEL